jgi:HEAT repeat protein/lysophospholipase L1-like esterase
MKPSTESPPPQSLVANLALSVVVSVVFLGAAEGLARLVEKPRKVVPPEKRVLMWDEGWHGQFYTMRSNAVGWPPWEEFNRDGVRDRTHAQEKPEGTWRVVCLGDSVTVGPDGRPQDAYPQILQMRLDALGPGVEILNVSLWGWATRQERIAYQRIVRKYRPDQVVLGVCLNDFEEMQNNLSRPPPLVAALYRRSALVRRLTRAEEREIAGVEELFSAPDSARVKEGFDRVFAEIRALREEVRADGAELVVTIFPFIEQVVPGAPPPSVETRIGAFCAREGIRFVDPLPGLRPLGRAAFPEGDGGHFNGLGAARIADELLRSGIIPEEVYSIGDLHSTLGPVALDARAVPALVTALGSVNPRTRAQAAWALGRIGPAAKGAVPALEKVLRDPSESVRSWATIALGSMGAEARPAFEALAQGLEDERENVRARSAEAIFRVGSEPERAVPVLRTALRSGDLYVRGFAAWYLGELGPAAQAAVPDVALTLKRDDGGVRALAVRTLGKIAPGDRATVTALGEALLDQGWDERWRAARILGKMGTGAAPAVPALIAALADANELVRGEAAAALGRIGPAASAAGPALVRAQKDAVPEVRAAATGALRKLRTPP